jgi:HD-like signal output (HDOD) protein
MNIPLTAQSNPGKPEKFDVKAFALELRQDIEQNRIRLPTLPTLSLEALLVVNDAASNMTDIGKIIGKDTSMATRLVRYANSPLYGGVHKVTSVKGAVIRIGVNAVRSAILNLAMHDVFTTHHTLIQDRMEGLWKHSVAVAIRAVLLASYFKQLDRGEAMLAGLIHDVGIIPVLIKASEYSVLLEKGSNLDKLVSHLHMTLGKFILSFWNFDPFLVEVAGSHDNLDRDSRGEDVDYLDIIQVANVLSYDGTDHPYTQLDLSEIPVFEKLGIDLIEEVRQKMAAGEYESELTIALQ